MGFNITYLSVNKDWLVDPDDIKKAVGGWANQTYHAFPWKHCLQNPDCETTALFYYMGDSSPKLRNPPYRKRKYRLLRKSDS